MKKIKNWTNILYESYLPLVLVFTVVLFLKLINGISFNKNDIIFYTVLYGVFFGLRFLKNKYKL